MRHSPAYKPMRCESLQLCEVFLSAYKPERKALRRVRGSYLRQSWERRHDLLHSESWEELQMIIQWERRSVELDVHVAEHKVNMWNPKVLGASSCEQKWRWYISLLWTAELMRKLQMILLCEAVGKKICRVDLHVDEHKWTCEYLVLLCNVVNERYEIPMDVPLGDEN